MSSSSCESQQTVCFDMNGQIPNNSVFCPDVNSTRKCIGTIPEFTLIGDIGSNATSVNQAMVIPGFGGIQTSGGSPIFNITDLRNLSPYVVGPNSEDSEYTSVQEAIDRAVADGGGSLSFSNQQVVLIKAGIYTENINLTSNIHLLGLKSGACNIRGTVFVDSVSDVSLSNLSIENSSTTSVFFCSGTSSEVILTNVNILQTGIGSGLLLTDTAAIICINTSIRSTAGIAVDNTGTGELICRTCEIISTMGTAMRSNNGGLLTTLAQSRILGMSGGLAIDLSGGSRMTFIGSFIISGGVSITNTAQITVAQGFMISGDSWNINNDGPIPGGHEFIGSFFSGSLTIQGQSPVSAQFCTFVSGVVPTIAVFNTGNLNLISCFLTGGINLDNTAIVNFWNCNTTRRIMINGSGGTGPTFNAHASNITTVGVMGGEPAIIYTSTGGIASIVFCTLNSLATTNVIDASGSDTGTYRRGVSPTGPPVTNAAPGTTTIFGGISLVDITLI